MLDCGKFFKKKKAKCRPKTSSRSPSFGSPSTGVRGPIPRDVWATVELKDICEGDFKEFVKNKGQNFIRGGVAYICLDLCEKMTALDASKDALKTLVDLVPEKLRSIEPEVGQQYDSATMLDINATGYTDALVAVVHRPGIALKEDGKVLFKALVEI